MKLLPPLLTAGVLAACLAAPNSAAAQSAISPGYWETTSKVTSPFPTRKTERRCIKPHDVTKFMEGKINHIYTCTYPTREIQDGKITLKGTCVSKKGQKVAIAGSGTYTKTSFQLDADVAVEFAGLNIAGRATTEAHRIGDTCPMPPAPKTD